MAEFVYLSLGSNLGDRSANLRAAIERLGEAGAIRAVSGFYETEPVELRVEPQSDGASVRLQVRARDPKFQPLDNAAVTLKISRAGAPAVHHDRVAARPPERHVGHARGLDHRESFPVPRRLRDSR